MIDRVRRAGSAPGIERTHRPVAGHVRGGEGHRGSRHERESEEPERGVTAVNLGEPAAREVRGVLLDMLRASLTRDRD